jgi:hypothetical protein
MLAATGATDNEEAADWCIQVLGQKNSDSFTKAASNLGVLLHSKVMDAESYYSMWEEANVALRSQRIIKRHLANHFGRRLTVSEI